MSKESEAIKEAFELSVNEALKDSRFRKSVGRGTVKSLHDDYAIVFVPSTSYYNQGRNVVASSIEIVFRNHYEWNGRQCQAADAAEDTRPTKQEIAKAESIAETLLETVTTIEEYAVKVGPGVVLEYGKYGTLVDSSQVPVVFVGPTYNNAFIKRNDNNTFVTTTPEFEASEKQRLLEERQVKRNEAVEQWIATYEAATPEEKRAIVSNIVRI